MFLLFPIFYFVPKLDDDKSASDNQIANEKSSQESIDDVKKRIKSLKVDRENDDGKTWPFQTILTIFCLTRIGLYNTNVISVG